MEDVVVEDVVERCLRLLDSDGRKKLAPEERASVGSLWRREFVSVNSSTLEGAVETWIRENSRGRPRVAELWTILKRQATSPKERARARWEEEKRAELAWAVSILERPDHFQGPDYKHTLDYAERCLRYHGFSSWEKAKAFLEPGWAPSSTVTEIQL